MSQLNSLHGKKIYIYAPNLEGGGIVFLKSFFGEGNLDICGSILPEKTRHFFPFLVGEKFKFVKKSYFLRLFFEFRLRSLAPHDSVIFCGHGIPPLFCLGHKIIVLLQNRILFHPNLISKFNLKRRLFLLIERWLLLKCFSRNYIYIASTPAMFELAKILLKRRTVIFVSHTFFYFPQFKITNKKKKYNFIYPASGEPHKNHINLIKCFVMLARQNIFPTLLLVFDPLEYPTLNAYINRFVNKFNLKISVISKVRHSEMPDLYLSSSALIFPSLTESLGLPLLEASRLSLDIISSNLDYVFDIVEPNEVFDPNNPLSIATAIINYLKIKL